MHTLKQLKRGDLKGAVSLKLAEELFLFPEEIFDLADTLEILDLSQNKLSELPADFGRLKKLKILFCSENKFAILPAVLSDCPQLSIVGFKSNQIEIVPEIAIHPNLRWLILTNNRIKSLPATIGRCTQLEKLMLAGNQLKRLPIALRKCRKLALLRIAANQLGQLPAWLPEMPQLAWLAFSGNPFAQKAKIESLPAVDWETVQVNQLLGEGASGLISKAVWADTEGHKEVAIKVFKGAVTSDGLPEDEMRINIAAGNHPGLVKLIGQLYNHPAGKKGLVMELIEPSFFNLGLPPSFETCTRDTFTKGLSLTANQVLKIASLIADVAVHIHQKGIMHGDLYAHNILIDNHGDALLGDFGAASFYPIKENEIASALERIEVKAFGYLLDDLLSLCDEGAANQTLHELKILSKKAMADEVLTRPDFKTMATQISTLIKS